MIEGEDYKVVDECLEDDNLLNPQNKWKNMKNQEKYDTKNPIEMKMSNSDMYENRKVDMEENTNVKCNITSDIKEKQAESDVSTAEIIEINPEEDKKSVDFTVDITLNQVNEHKDLIDEEVMHHLDVIENIVLDPNVFLDTDINQSFEIESLSKCIVSKDQEEDKKNIEYIDISSPDNKQIDKEEEAISEEKVIDNMETHNTEINWYEKKVKTVIFVEHTFNSLLYYHTSYSLSVYSLQKKKL